MQFEWEFPNTVECEEVKTCYWKLEKELESRSSGNQWNQFLKLPGWWLALPESNEPSR